MPDKTALSYALDMFTVPLHCHCGRSWQIKSKRIRPQLQTVCPGCRAVSHIDAPTAIRINQELNDAMRQVADRLGVQHVPIPIPKHRAARAIKPREPKGYPVGLVGESFYQPAIHQCHPGDRVQLIPEPTNPHDPRAIMVVARDSVIGYIPRSSFVQRLIYDERGEHDATILSLKNDDDGGHIGVVIDVEIR